MSQGVQLSGGSRPSSSVGSGGLMSLEHAVHTQPTIWLASLVPSIHPQNSFIRVLHDTVNSTAAAVHSWLCEH